MCLLNTIALPSFDMRIWCRIFFSDLGLSNSIEESMPRPALSIGKPVVMFTLVIEMYASKVFPISESGIAEKLERDCD